MIDVPAVDVERLRKQIVRALHGTSALKGIVVISNFVSLRRKGSPEFPQPSLADLERSVQMHVPANMGVRIVIWREGESLGTIRTAIADVVA